MKWIGQHIYDQIARFRNNVYIDGALYMGASEILSDSSGTTTLKNIDALDATTISTIEAAVETNIDTLNGTITLNNDSSSGGPALIINNDDVDQVALSIDTSNTTANILEIASTALTTGGAFKIDVNDGVTATKTGILAYIDYDKNAVTAAEAISTTTGLRVSMDDASTNHADSVVTMTGAQVGVSSANAQGTLTQTGLNLQVATNGVADTATTYGIDMTVVDGAKDIVMRSHADSGDYFSIATTTHGATTIATVDDNATAAHLIFDTDGDIRMAPETGLLKFTRSNSLVDYLSLEITTDGGAIFTTVDAAAHAADVTFAVDGDFLIDNDGVGLTKITSDGVEIENSSTSGVPALLIDNDDIDEHAIKIDASNTTQSTLQIAATAQTTGSVININADSLTTGSAILLDIDDALTASATKTLLDIDYDKAGVTASGQTSLTYGMRINMEDGATNNALGAVQMVGARIDVDSTSNQGTITQKGLVLKVAADGNADHANTFGIETEVVDNGTDIKMVSHADSNDYCTIATTTNGATTITTVDGDAASAHFEIAADGNIVLDAAGEVTVEADTINFTSPNADDPAIWIKNTANDDQATRLLFLKNRGADGQDGDECGAIYFYSYDDGTPSLQQYGYILSTIHDATSGEESGKLDIGVANHDGGAEPGISMQGGSENGEVDVTIATGSNSLTTVSGDLRITGDITHGLLTHYRFMGYGTGDGTNYFLGQSFTDNQAPWEHADSSSSDGLTIPASSGTNVSELMRSGGHVMPNAGTLTRWTGWITSNGTSATYLAIFKWTPTDNDNSDITPVLLDEVNVTAAGNDKPRSFAETSFTQASVAAGDIIFTQIKPASSRTIYFNSTLEVAITQ